MFDNWLRDRAKSCRVVGAEQIESLKRRPLADRLIVGFATLGPVGTRTFAPGTWGSLVAVVLAPWLFLPLSAPGQIFLLAVVFALGGLAATRAEAHFGRCDPGAVIIDEVVGMWVTLLPVSGVGLPSLVAGFLLFRLFDIWKPWPVRWCETCLPQGFGIMIDDVAAGIYAAIGLLLLRMLFGIA